MQEIPTLTGDSSPLWVVRFSPTGRFLAVSGQNPVITVFETTSGGDGEVPALLATNSYRSFVGHGKTVVDLSWDSSGSRFVSASMDKTAILWRVDSSFQE